MRELLGRTLHDIAQVLESAQGSEGRILRVLELVRRIVPYEQCALLRAEPERERRLVVVPTPPPDEQAFLLENLLHLHARLVDERVHPPEPPSRPWRGAHLVVPLIGDDMTIGVLFVRDAAPDGAAGGYNEQHLRELSIVGAHLAGYLVVVDQARALDQARREAEASNRMKDEFLALVSHELKTPLTSTLAWAHVLGSSAIRPSDRARALEAIERSVRAQVKLIDEILDLACIVTADLRLDLEPVEAASLIKAAVEEQRLRAEGKSVRLDTDLDESVPPLVVDPVRIVQVISNLLAKAIHFTPSGGHVGVTLKRAGGHARIQVIDHGKTIPPVSPQAFEETDVMSIARLAGVPPEVLCHVFETFCAGQDPVTRAFGELGIGLAIVKTLVEAHGGHVRAERLAEEDGSSFTVELPLPAEAPEREGPALAGLRVLLVDDDNDMLAAACSVLEHHGAEVTAVASAAAALEALERSRPHVLVSDITMPGESGWDLMRKVAARDATLPAAALTALAKDGDRKRALEAGFRMHLTKPFEAETLVAAVATLAGRLITNSVGEARNAHRNAPPATSPRAARRNLH